MTEKPLPPIRPVTGRRATSSNRAPRVSDAEVERILTGLEPGRYQTGDLYLRYSALAAQEGREPAPRNALGMSLGRYLNGPYGRRMLLPGAGTGVWTVSADLAAKLNATPDR